MELTHPKVDPVEPASAPAQRTMPDFTGGTHAHHHSVHSALVSLQALGVGAYRISLRRAGRHALSADLIVAQTPRAGEPLTDATVITLDVAGLGFTHALPVGMWDSGGEAAAGTREILEHLDDPLEKLRHWFHEGAPLFRIAPDNLPACARWLALFGVDAQTWPVSLWYPLASIMAQLPQLACSDDGFKVLLHALLGLPVRSTHYRPCREALPDSTLSRLGSRSSRLGVDLLMGDAVEDLAMLVIEIGPVSLKTYEHFTEQRDGKALLQHVLELAIPVSTRFELTWSVDDLRQGPVLGVAEKNARLGINTHLGALLPERNNAWLTHVATDDTVWSAQ